MGARYTQGFVRQLQDRAGKPWRGYVKDTQDRKQRTRMLKTYQNRNGKTVPVKTETDAKKALDQWRTELEEAAIKEADAIPTASTDVADYVNSYIDDLEVTQSVEASTLLDYRKSARRIADAFPDMPLCDLNTAQIQKWEGQLLKSGLSASTVGKAHRLLKMVLKHAVQVRDLTWNPADAVKPPKRTNPTPNSLTAESGARLAMTLQAMEATPLVVGATLSLFSGMREGEVTGLRWREVDMDNHIIHVRESIGTGKGGAFSKTPKTTSSRRDVPISKQMEAVLQARRAIMVDECEEAGVDPASMGNMYVLGNVVGDFYNPTILSREWASLAKALGLVGTQGRRITYHDLRHTFATLAIASGADVKSVSSVLGHANAAMTLNVYASADPTAKARASRLVSQAFEPTGDMVPYAIEADSVE